MFPNTHSPWHLISRREAWGPPTDVIEAGDAVYVRVEIAGMGDEELSVTLDPPFLLIQGSRPSPKEEGMIQQLEIGYGRFQRGIKLPVPVELEGTKATYKDGILEVKLPKASSRQIEVKE